MCFTSQINVYKMIKKLSWSTMFNLADVLPGYSTKVSSQKDMRHPTTNWHSVNSANYPEFVMVLPMATLTRISHESLHTCFAHLYSWLVTELWRDPSQRDSLEFSIRIPTFLWVIPVLSDCTMSLATSRTRSQHISLPSLSNQASSSIPGRLWGQQCESFLFFSWCWPVNLFTTN